VFGIVAAGVLDKAARDTLVARDPTAAVVLDSTPRAESFFLDPTGEQIGDSLRDDEGILYADIDLNLCVEPKQFHDVVGYYNRFDIFDLSVNRRRLNPVCFTNDPAPVSDAAENDDEGRSHTTTRIGF
jgi:nitrilase